MRGFITGLFFLLSSLGFADEARQLRPDHAPTPYSALEIAACCAHGRTVVFEVSTPQEKMHQKTRFLLPDAEGVEVEVVNISPRTGKPAGPVRGSRAAWTSLQKHASFPKSVTTIAPGEVTTPAGSFRCQVYTLAIPSGKRVFYFARDLAGPPVKMVAFDPAGKQVMSMTLIRHAPFDFPTYFGDQKWEGRAVREDLAYAATASIVKRTGKNERMIVVASLKVTEGEPIRHAALEITKGMLKGAVLRLTNEKPNPKGSMIVSREFELPKAWNHQPGPLEFKPVDLR